MICCKGADLARFSGKISGCRPAFQPSFEIPEKIKVTRTVPENIPERHFNHPGVDDHEYDGSGSIAHIG